MSNTTYTLKMSVEDKRKLEAQAKKAGVKPSALARYYITKHLK